MNQNINTIGLILKRKENNLTVIKIEARSETESLPGGSLYFLDREGLEKAVENTAFSLRIEAERKQEEVDETLLYNEIMRQVQNYWTTIQENMIWGYSPKYNKIKLSQSIELWIAKR